MKDIQSDLLVALLNTVSHKCNQRPLANDLHAQGIANLLWAMAKLVDSGHELTPELKIAVAALLPHIKEMAANFKPQEIANLLWAIAKLVESGHERTPELEIAVAVLLPYVKAKAAKFTPQEIANQLWAMAKLADSGHKPTAEFKYESMYRLAGSDPPGVCTLSTHPFRQSQITQSRK